MKPLKEVNDPSNSDSSAAAHRGVMKQSSVLSVNRDALFTDTLPITVTFETATGVTSTVTIGGATTEGGAKALKTTVSTHGEKSSVANIRMTKDELPGGSANQEYANLSGAPVGPPPPDKVPCTSSGLSVEALDRREKYLAKKKEELQMEKQFLDVGRDELNRQINRHKGLMKASIEELNEQLDTEQNNLVTAIVREMELFKLPRIQRLLPTDTVEGLMSEAKKLGEECNRLCM